MRPSSTALHVAITITITICPQPLCDRELTDSPAKKGKRAGAPDALLFWSKDK